MLIFTFSLSIVGIKNNDWKRIKESNPLYRIKESTCWPSWGESTCMVYFIQIHVKSSLVTLYFWHPFWSLYLSKRINALIFNSASWLIYSTLHLLFTSHTNSSRHNNKSCSHENINCWQPTSREFMKNDGRLMKMERWERSQRRQRRREWGWTR